MAYDYDIIIIGGGNAGFGVSAVAHEAGLSLAFIENWDFGGTCPNRGCTPKKILVAAANALHEIDLAPSHGITVGAAKLDWKKLIQRKNDMIGFIPDAMANTAKDRGDVFRGTAKFTGPNSVSVNGSEITGSNIIIATGSRHRDLPIPGAELMTTSDDVLSEETQPKDLVFIGGGVVALEFTHVYARAGTNVTILEAMPSLLPRFDKDAVAKVCEATSAIGATIRTGVKVQAITKENNRLTVSFEIDGKAMQVSADRVVNGTGRVANVDQLDLAAGLVTHDGFAIKTDAAMRSVSNPAVWVCGDALTTSAQLSPVATYEGRLVGKSIVTKKDCVPDYSVIPNCVFTVPAMCSVGLTDSEALAQGLKFTTSENDLTGWFSSRFYAESTAWAKVLVDDTSDLFIGAQIVGHHGEELIHFFAMAMRHGITASALKDDIYAFPTFSSDLKSLF